MRHSLALTLCIGALAALSGCASPDHVLFVTKTSIGVDFDSKPGTASLAYDRTEGYAAPRYANGEIPPVVASVKSNGGIFSPVIRQIYATGDAAIIATGGAVPRDSRKMQGERTLMFFGTTTTTGIKVGFTTGLPDSVVFGFRRKEYSYIPLATVETQTGTEDVYPSVLASIDTAANVSADGTVNTTELANAQFFATGAAARRLAQNTSITAAFREIARESIQQRQANNVNAALATADTTDALLSAAVDRYQDAATTAAQRTLIVAAAQDAGLDADKSMTVVNFSKKITAFASTAPADEAQKKLRALNAQISLLMNQ